MPIDLRYASIAGRLERPDCARSAEDAFTPAGTAAMIKRVSPTMMVVIFSFIPLPPLTPELGGNATNGKLRNP